MARGSTYVNVSRADLEDWLDNLVRSNPSYMGWSAVSGTSGVYLIHLSQFVSVKVSSTLTSRDSAKGKGQASTKLSLVSRLFPRMVLNKKSNKQKSFYRTTNWRTTWAAGIDYLVNNSYRDKSDFYDNIARIEDRSAYQADKIKAIESINGWASKPYLVKYHQSLTSGFILWPNQEKVIEDILAKQSPQSPQQSPRNTVPSAGEHPWALGSSIVPMYDIDELRDLYRRLREYMREKREIQLNHGVSYETINRYLNEYQGDLAFIAEVGKKQVAGQRPTQEERERIDNLFSKVKDLEETRRRWRRYD